MFSKIFQKVLISSFVLLIFSNNKISRAQENESFIIGYDTRYDVFDSGEVLVTQQTTITSLKNDTVPTSYTFITKQSNITEVSAVTNGKKAETRIDKSTPGTTSVVVTFSTYAIGKDKQNIVNLTYKTKDICTKVGDVWNINIPGIKTLDTTTMNNVVLSVPISFGPKIFVSPNPSIEKNEDQKYIYNFTKEDLKNSSISASFGNYQLLNFRIKYQLKNDKILGTAVEVAFPPDIPNIQQVEYKFINPKPRKITLDKDGNALAVFWIAPKNSLEVTLTGSAKILGRQINVVTGGRIEDIPKSLVKAYTKNQKFWEVDNDSIKKFSASILDPTLTVSQNTQRIYDYITSNLTYDYSAPDKTVVERKGAYTALTQRGSWTCMEFSDLFIATSRAMGVPAREINGYAFTNDNSQKPISVSTAGGDLLHSWAEYYDPAYGWVQVDPTWGATSGIDYFTKLDTNHFAFVIKGANSEYPYPAGVYRFNDNEKLVDVDFSRSAETKSEFSPNLLGKKVINFNPVKLLQGYIRYSVLNNSGYFVYNVGGKTLAPGQKTSVYLKNGETEITITDFRNKEYKIKII